MCKEGKLRPSGLDVAKEYQVCKIFGRNAYVIGQIYKNNYPEGAARVILEEKYIDEGSIRATARKFNGWTRRIYPSGISKIGTY